MYYLVRVNRGVAFLINRVAEIPQMRLCGAALHKAGPALKAQSLDHGRRPLLFCRFHTAAKYRIIDLHCSFCHQYRICICFQIRTANAIDRRSFFFGLIE
jgi:hypothetical protein